jgi:alpha-N-acetylglucosamine transferase
MRARAYERVILLDTDTFVAGELLTVFDLLDRYDLAAVVDVTRGYDYGMPVPPRFPRLTRVFWRRAS